MSSQNPQPRPRNLSSNSSQSPAAKNQPQIVRITATSARTEDPATQPAGREWWAQRWIDVLESFGWRRRLERARNYAREGKVLSLAFQGAEVIAQVQGTAPEPYEVSLALDPFSDEQWEYVIEEMSQRAIFAAKLLAGEMPQNIEETFTASGLSLFPFSKFDIHSHCSCPDPVNPCKHIGAVYYLLGDHFSQDPFILFQLRGQTKQQIIAALRRMRSASAIAAAPEKTTTQPLVKTTPPSLDDQFWQYNEQLDPSLVVIAPPPSSETILDILGAIPLEPNPRGSSRSITASNQVMMECLEKIYQRVSQQALLSAMATRETD
jgi:uncharacterized Zn finger protein